MGQPRLPFGPASSPACLPVPSLSRVRRPPRPIQRRPRGGRTPTLGAPRPTTPSPWSGRRPAPQTTPSILSPAPSPSFLRLRSSSSSAARHCQRKPRRSPPAAPELQTRRQERQRTRRRRGKPLRTLYRGEKQPCAVNRSPELLRPRRRAPPRRILRYPTSFRSLFSALGP